MRQSHPARSVPRAEIEWDELWHLYRVMLAARFVDQVEAEYVRAGAAFFQVSCTGHEGVVALAPHLVADDWLHLHYRDKALLLARGMPVEMCFHSLLCTADSHSAGRQMSAHFSDPERRVLSMVGPVGNSALQAVGVAAQIKADRSKPIVLCSVGDGTTQQGEFLEAVAEAVRSELPVLFWIEDNGYSISTQTAGKTFFSLPGGRAPREFFGLPIHRIDGRDVIGAHAAIGPIVSEMRTERKPALVVFQVERISNHTNADDQRVYRSQEEIDEASRNGDPITRLGKRLLAGGMDQADLDAAEADVWAMVRSAAHSCETARRPSPAMSASRPLPTRLTPGGCQEYRGDAARAKLTMLEALREALRRRLADDSSVMLLGEDIEDPKGDVFGLTRGLTREFPGRVINSALSESTIIGASIGRALAGAKPVAFIQFADFMPLALNQILSELGSMYWRTVGGWQCPVVVMIACGGYRPGLGPFHAQTFESIAAHTPGIDVVMPSSAGDAAGLLNAAFESGRPTLFFYPKACLNDRATATSDDIERHIVPLGAARHVARGTELTIVTWGSTVGICQQVVSAIEAIGLGCDLLDLRSIAPWDRDAVVKSTAATGRLLVVHEDNLTCGFGAEVVASVVQAAARPIAVRRVTRPDTYVPCNYENQLALLPSFESVLTAAAELLDLSLEWKQSRATQDDSLVEVEAIGSSPADQMVSVTAWKVRVGDTVAAGQLLAEAEADKAVFEIDAPCAGLVRELVVAEGEGVPVGTVLARIEVPLGETNGRPQRAPRMKQAQPILRRRAPAIATSRREAPPKLSTVGMSSVYTAEGSLTITNDDLVQSFPHRTAEEILRLTGITSRRRIAPDESVVTLATSAARKALAGEGLGLSDVGAIICSTGTPSMITPSLACLVHHQLAQSSKTHDIPAYDILAACTGYLYALAAGYEFIQAHPGSNVLVLTAEAMSTVVNPRDFDTAVLFGDAASATVLYGDSRAAGSRAVLRQPLVSARGENGVAVRLGAPGCGYVEMDGRKVFAEAVRQMLAMLERACVESGITAEMLDLIVPHQANGRIIEAVRSRLNGQGSRIVNAIAQCGNTSSSSIPLCLAGLLERQPPGRRIGLCAFGGGFTFGAALLETVGGADSRDGKDA